ncbi:hypothetical protein AURDEDRAFT_68228, partial [Auricularia subglabra TFB-10046 SS5]
AFHHPWSRAVSNTTLGEFLTSSVNAFFPAPGNDGWDVAFDKAFAPNVTATFNDGSHNLAQFKAYFTAVKANLEQKYQTFDHWFTAVVAVCATRGLRGGYGIVTGVEGGQVSGKPVWGTDGAFAVIREIDGQLKITEWREITNLGAPSS